jgi:hypothetical protein
MVPEVREVLRRPKEAQEQLDCNNVDPCSESEKTHYPVLYSAEEPLNLILTSNQSSYEKVQMHFRQLTKINSGG